MNIFGIHFCMDEARAILVALPFFPVLAIYLKAKLGG